jgi:hypothetical protein
MTIVSQTMPFDLLGLWQIKRQITDHGSALTFFEGQALVTSLEQGLMLYHETGILMQHAQPFQAERRYIFKPSLSNWTIYFEETPLRVFQSFDFYLDLNLDLSLDVYPKRSRSSHVCGADLYESALEIMSSQRFELVHLVKGARKNYVSETVYEKLDVND